MNKPSKSEKRMAGRQKIDQQQLQNFKKKIREKVITELENNRQSREESALKARKWFIT